MASLNDTYSILTYVDKTTKTSSKCKLVIAYRITNTNRNNAVYTVEFLPAVVSSATLFYAGGGSSTNLTVNGSSIGSQTTSPAYSWSTGNTMTVGGTTYKAVGYLLDSQGDSTPVTNIQGSFSGTTSVKVVLTYVGGGNAYGISGTTTLEGTLTLARVVGLTSTVTNSTSSSSRANFGDTVTFSITRPADNITHTLKYTPTGGSETTIGTGIATSKTYAFPTSLISNYPNTTTPNITVTNTNSNGLDSSTTVYLQVPSSYVPTVSSTISTASYVPTGATGVSGTPYLYQGHSSLKVNISASGVSGSTISSYSTTVEGSTYTTNSFTTSTLKNSGSQTITTTVKDSRGRTASVSKTFYVIPYHAPMISNLKTVRCDANGNESENGTYGKVSFGYDISPAGSDNVFTINIACGSQSLTLTDKDLDFTGTYTSGAIFSGLSNDQKYTVNVEVADNFYGGTGDGYPYPTITYAGEISPSAVTISKLAGGKGVSFGQTATLEGLHSYMDAYFHKKIIGIFPIGAIYMSVDPTDPKEYFGGTWTLLKDRFLVGAGNSYSVNSTGGYKATQTHTHSIPALSGTAAAAGGHSHTYWIPPKWSFRIGTSTQNTVTDEAAAGLSDARSTSSVGNHTHTVSTNASTTGSFGSGAAASATDGNMPPYLAVYMWKRTA